MLLVQGAWGGGGAHLEACRAQLMHKPFEIPKNPAYTYAHCLVKWPYICGPAEPPWVLGLTCKVRALAKWHLPSHCYLEIGGKK